jgi:hypothetical protein
VKKNTLPAGMSHAWEKFYLAVDELATGRGDVRSRLRAAYFHLKIIHHLEIPKNLLRDYNWIIRMLTRREPRRESDTPVKASTEQMRNSTGVKIAKRILSVERSLHRLLQEEYEEAMRLR